MMTECFSDFDTLVIAYLILGMAAGIIIGACWVDSIHKSRKNL